MTYNWQRKDWPKFTYDIKSVEATLFEFAELAGRISGMVEALPEDTKMDVILATLVAEASKSSEIEGEYLSRQDVISSIRHHIGLDPQPLRIKDKRASGISELILDVRKTYRSPLTENKMLHWHRMLMKGNHYIRAGRWRRGDEPMQVVSGAVGKEKVHFEAPPSRIVPKEMKAFINWFNESAPKGKKELQHGPIRAAIAHLYFESIHPFEDGNGRIGRALSEKSLSQDLGSPLMFSISQAIEANKKAYYNALKNAQRSNEITNWLQYFMEMLLQAQKQGEGEVLFVLKKARFFDKFRGQFNERQIKVIGKMLEHGPDGFEGGMNARKYVSLTKSSKATATRDLQDLVEKGAFVVTGGGRSTSYQVDI
jgi:Fic family protein